MSMLLEFLRHPFMTIAFLHEDRALADAVYGAENPEEAMEAARQAWCWLWADE